MKKNTGLLIILFFFIFQFTIFPSGKTKAEELDNNIILLIDNSGSMGENDPAKLALVAASMLIDTMEVSDKINVISFGTKVQSPFRLRDNPLHDKLKSSFSMFDYNDKYTNLKDGIEEALSQLEEVKGSRRIIVLSDGNEDPEEGLTETHLRELNALKQRAHSMQTSIFTIGLSENADKDMLARLAYDTGGASFFCKNPADLFDIFSRIMGSAEGLSTIERYTTDSVQEKTINFSSDVEEIVIKTASTDNKNSNVKVLKDGIEVIQENYHDKYKIYKIKNDKDCSITIISQDSFRNVVIVQLKSRINIKINTTDKNFRIPARIPLEIEAIVDTGAGSRIVNMYTAEGSIRQLMKKENGAFSFSFQRDAKGDYPIVLVACDGNNNIMAVRNIEVSITDYPPFYYAEELSKAMITDKPIPISLKQLFGEKISSISAEVIASYGDTFERFPLKHENGVLEGELLFKKSGEVSITTCISGIYNNEAFSYYLPSQRVVIGEKARLYLETANGEGILKQGKESILHLNIKDILLYREERIEIYDKAGNRIGNFIVKPDKNGEIDIKITPVDATGELIIVLKGQEDLNLTGELRTGIRVLTPLKYFLTKYMSILIGSAVILFLLLSTAFAGLYVYKSKILKYKIVKELCYRAKGPFKVLSIELGTMQKCVYLNLGANDIYESKAEEKPIGYFELVIPDYNPIILGLMYILKGKSIFRVRYDGIMEQKVLEGYEDAALPVNYRSDITIRFNYRNLNCEIQFQ